MGGRHLLVASSFKGSSLSLSQVRLALDETTAVGRDRCISPALVSRPSFVSIKSHMWIFFSVLMISSSETDEWGSRLRQMMGENTSK